VFNVAVKWGYLENSPVFGVDRPAPKTDRDRSLSEGEIRKLWQALDQEVVQMSDEIRRALKLILVTAQRPGEVIGLHRSEIDGQWWTIPANRSKNGRPHRVFLTELAIELIGTTDGYIFPSPTGKGHIDVNAVALTLRRNIKGVGDGKKRKRPKAIPKEPAPNRIGIEFFRPHDLRRTAVTGMAALRIPWEVRERVVNHTLGRLEKIYNQHDYDDEKRLALQKWTNKLKAVIFGQETKVVVLRQGRRQRSDSQG
jgi:integrase